MKNIFTRSSGHLRGGSWMVLLGLLLSAFAAGATQLVFLNNGTITTPINVDATYFVNNGTWNIDTTSITPLPYTTANTLGYTNSGTMTASVGWEFDFGNSLINRSFYGGPYLSANFLNNNGCTIQANDGSVANPPNAQYTSLVSYLLVCATNIVNKGSLLAGPHGEIVLQGNNVTLARSTLGTTSIQGQGSGNGLTNWTPDVQVYSEFWGTNAFSFISSNLWNGTIIPQTSFLVDGNVYIVPSYSNISNVASVVNQNITTCGVLNMGAQIVPFVPALMDSTNIQVVMTNYAYTNFPSWPSWSPIQVQLGNTNVPAKIIRQAVFLNLPGSSGLTGKAGFAASPVVTNFGKTVSVALSMVSTNPVTQALQTNSVYLVDTTASETNYGLIPSTETFNPYYICSGPVFRPANFIVQRTDAGNYSANSVPGAGSVPINFYSGLLGNPMSNGVVQANYSDYAALIDNFSADQQLIGEVTNLGGRIIINANNLDLSRSVLVGGGSITIQASNLVGSVGASANSPNLSYNLGSTTGNLNVTNLAGMSQPALNGYLTAWSGAWTNYSAQVIPDFNWDGTTNTPVPIFITNTTEIDFYTLVVDASSLSNQVPVTVENLQLHSLVAPSNIVVGDSMQVAGTFLLDGMSATLEQNITFISPLDDWTAACAPNLLNLINYGFLSIPNDAHFGDDRAVPYSEFVNNGVVFSADQTIDSLDLQIIGGINFTFVGDFSATARSIEIGNASFYSIYSANNINFSANTLNFNAATLLANGSLNFNLTNTLSDNGTACSFTCYQGFNLWSTPINNYGDLAASTITDIATVDKEEIDHAWAGVDYGNNLAGFRNNTSIGTLVLSAQNPDSGYYEEPLFHFYGTGGASSNAMYVMTLDLSHLTANSTDVANMLQIDPGMKIYFSQVILGFVPSGNQSPADFLQALFPGQAVKVPNLVTAQSGTVDSSIVYQKIDGFGASSAFSQRTWSSNTADIFFSTNTVGTNVCIGLSLLRNEIQPGGYVDSSEQGLMKLAQARGARLWSTPWSPQASFKDNNNTVGGNFLSASNRAYAAQLANYVKTNAAAGITIYAVSIQNEPDANVSYVSCHWTSQQIHDFTTNLYSVFQASNVTAKIILPESQNWTDPQGLAADTVTNPASLADMDIIANHNYVNNNVLGDQNPPAAVPTYGKALWETEVATLSGSADPFNPSIGNAMYWATRIHLFMTVAQANAWHYWYLITGTTPSDNEGLMGTGDVPSKRMYVLGQFSRFVRPGYYRIGANSGGNSLLVSAYQDTNSGAFAIVAINTNINVDVVQTYTLNNFAAGTVTPWITSASQSLAVQASMDASSGSFTFTNPAQSVVTFVGTGTDFGVPSAILQLTPVPDQTANAGMTLLVTNTATASNPPLTFGLLNGPTGATLAPLSATGAQFAWQPTASQAGTTNAVSVVVTDSSTPSLTATNTFNIKVNVLPTTPMFNSISAVGGQINLALTGPTGQTYMLLTSTNLVTWQTSYTTLSLPISLAVTNGGGNMRFYRIKGP